MPTKTKAAQNGTQAFDMEALSNDAVLIQSLNLWRVCFDVV